MLWLMQRRVLRQPLGDDVAQPALSISGGLAAGGIVPTILVLMAASASGLAIGLPTFLAGIVTTTAVMLVRRAARLHSALDGGRRGEACAGILDGIDLAA